MANLINQTLRKTYQDGFLQLDYTETYQVTASGPASACLASGVPQIGDPVLLSGTTDVVWCMSQEPRRRSDRDAKTIFDVTCVFTNASTKFERDVNGNPAQNPEDIVPKLDIGFEEYTEPATDAHLIGFTEAESPDPFLYPIRTPPPYLQNRQSIDVGNFMGGPVVNSANDSVPNIQQRRHNKRMTYWSWHRDWNPAWEQYLDKVNLFNLTLSQYDGDGLRLQYTFEPLTVVINDLIKEDHWRNGKLYFRRGIAMMHNPRKWLTKVNDEGYNENVFAGQYKGSGATKFVAADLTDNDPMNRTLTYYKQPVVEENLQLKDRGVEGVYVAPGEFVQLNGYGRQLGISTPDQAADSTPKAAWYLTYRPADFSALGIF